MARRRRTRGNVVLAPVMRWLLWSPWRLLFGVVVVLVVAAVLSAIARGVTGSPKVAAASSPSTTLSDSASPTDTETTEPTDTISSSTAAAPATVSAAPTPPAALNQTEVSTAATRWVTAWAKPTLTAAAWRAGLHPMTYADFERRLISVDPANVPATKVGGRPTMVEFLAGVAHVRVPVAGGSAKAVTLTLIYYPMSPAGRWLVNGLVNG